MYHLFFNQQNGKVDPAKLLVLASWSRNLSIENVLVEIRKCVPSIFISIYLISIDVHLREMASLQQPKAASPTQGSTF